MLLMVGFVINPSGKKKDNSVLQTNYDSYIIPQ